MPIVTSAVRSLLGLVGLQIFRARGGVFICPAPRAGRAGAGAGATGPTRLHLGCGNVHLDGYMNIDLVPTPATDMVSDITRLPDFADASVDEVRLEAVLEHLFRHERLNALREWHRVLKPGGRLDVRYLPDFDVIVERYSGRLPGFLGPVFDIDEVYRLTHGDPVAWNAPEQLHKDVFTKESVARDLKEAGFANIHVENATYREDTVAANINAAAIKPL